MIHPPRLLACDKFVVVVGGGGGGGG
jgi:hypothetical protein